MTNQTSKELVIQWHLEHQYSREDDILILNALCIDMKTLKAFYKILGAEWFAQHYGTNEDMVYSSFTITINNNVQIINGYISINPTITVTGQW